MTTSVSANALAPSGGAVSGTSLSVPGTGALTPNKPRRKQSTKQKMLSHTDDDDIYTMKVRGIVQNRPTPALTDTPHVAHLISVEFFTSN